MKKTLICLCLGLLLTVQLTSPVHSIAADDDEKFQRRVTLDLGYLPVVFYSNNSIAEFGMSYTHLFSWLFDLPGDALPKNNNPLGIAGRAGLEVISFFLMSWPVDKFELTYHEYGHGTRLAAAGWSPIYYLVGSFNSPGSWGGPYNNFFTYFIADIFSSTGGGLTTSRSLGVGGISVPFNTWGAVISMGGLNNQMYFSELLEDDIYYNKGHLVYARFYYEGKLGAYGYAVNTSAGVFGGSGAGDLANIMNYYNSMGYNISLGDFQVFSIASLLLSATTYSLISSGIHYALTGDPTVRALEFQGFRLPEFNFYLTSKGLAYKIMSAYRYDKETIIPFSITPVFKGSFGSDLSAGYRREINSGGGNKMITQIGLTTNVPNLGAIGLDGFAQWKTAKQAYTLGAHLYNVYNFEGERNATNLGFGPFGLDIIANIMFYY